MTITDPTANGSLITPEPYQPPIVTRLTMYRHNAESCISGAITFKGKLGEVQLSLSDESCQRILALLADAAAESIAEVANALRDQFVLITAAKAETK